MNDLRLCPHCKRREGIPVHPSIQGYSDTVTMYQCLCCRASWTEMEPFKRVQQHAGVRLVDMGD